jgi:replication factor A1
MSDSYSSLISRISSSSGKSEDEIDRLVEAKKAKLSGLISKEGAAQIVAAELGISLDKQSVKIGQIMQGMRRINLTGKIIRLFPVREFNKNNRQGKVLSMVLADETGNIRCVLWDTNHISLFENESILEGNVVEIGNANLRNNEIHLTGFSDIKKSSEVLKDVKTEEVVKEKEIKDLSVGERVKLRAFIVQMFEPKNFDVCPECKKKASLNADGSATCNEHGKVVPERRALVTMILDDGTETIRAVVFNDSMEEMGIEKDPLLFADKKDSYLGKEVLAYGSVKKNEFFNNEELSVNKIEEINLDSIIKQLEEKIKAKNK